MFKFGTKSKQKMAGAHDDLQAVLNRAIQLTKYDFGLSEVIRTLAKQKEYVRDGKSTTLNSRHIPDSTGLCYAVDVYAYVDGKASYETKHLRAIAKAMFTAAIELGIALEWGGHWSTFVDMPHYQLSFRDYPKQ
jgi:hypothetical protein